MKTTKKMLALLVSAVIVMLPTWAGAAPLDPSRIPADAKWVVHVDLKGLTETQLAERVRENRRKLLIPIRFWLQNRYGIDLREGLDSVTLFGNSYEQHTGTMILRADYDQSKVQANLEARPDVQKETHGSYTFYKLHQKNAARQSADRPSRSPEGTARREPRRELHAHHDRPVTIVLLGGKTAIMASSDDQAEAAIKLVEGKSTELATKDSPLVSRLTEGTLFYGAARDLGQIKEHEGFFPVLRQHDQIYVAAGVKNDQVFKNLVLIAKSEEIAENMKKALEGLDAFGLVWAADSENLTSIVKNREITRSGTTVELKGQCDRETAAKAIDELWQRLMMRFELGEDEGAGN